MSRKRLLPQLADQRVVLHTRDGQTFEGILESVHRDAIVMKASTPVLGEAQVAPLQGAHVVLCDNISSLQVLGMGG